jgi:GGDEF domain-containing protein
MSGQTVPSTPPRRVALAFALLNLALLVSVTLAAMQKLPIAVLGAIAVAITFGEFVLWWESAKARPVLDISQNRATRMIRSEGQRRGAIRDENTGLYQRWYLETRLVEEAARCKRYSHSMAVVVLRAGAINLSTWEEDAWQGRSLDVARRTAAAVRNVDLSAAIAPMEFALCLVHCDREGAETALGRIGESLPDGISDAGIAVYPDDQCEPSALIELARGRSRPLRVG